MPNRLDIHWSRITTCLVVEGVVCFRTSSADACTLLASSEGLGRDDEDILAGLRGRDPCGDIALEAALDLDTRSYQRTPSDPVCPDIPDQNTSGVFDVGHCAGFLDHAAFVGHSDLFWSPDTFSDLDACLDQGLAGIPLAGARYALLGLVLIGLEVPAFGLDVVLPHL